MCIRDSFAIGSLHDRPRAVGSRGGRPEQRPALSKSTVQLNAASAAILPGSGYGIDQSRGGGPGVAHQAVTSDHRRVFGLKLRSTCAYSATSSTSADLENPRTGRIGRICTPTRAGPTLKRPSPAPGSSCVLTTRARERASLPPGTSQPSGWLFLALGDTLLTINR